MEITMNQIKRKRRLTAIETAVLGNILYLIIVTIFKSVFDIIGRTNSFNYLFNGLELAVIGLFWILLFGRNFKNVYAGEKPQYLKYIFFALIPIVILTVALTLVSLLWPGQDTNSIWNQFAFLAAPTIFWYLPYGLIYQLVGNYVSIFTFFGIALCSTILFQIIGIILGRATGRKYSEETRVAEEEKRISAKTKKVKNKRDKKTKRNQEVSIGMERLSEEMINEGFRPGEQESMMMTEVIIEDATQREKEAISIISTEEIIGDEISIPIAKASESLFIKETLETKTKTVKLQTELAEETGLFTKVETIDDMEAFLVGNNGNNNQPIVDRVVEEVVETSVIEEITKETVTLGTSVSDEWQLTHPMDLDKIKEELDQHQKKEDKSFFMETSKIKIINEEDVEEYYRNKK